MNEFKYIYYSNIKFNNKYTKEKLILLGNILFLFEFFYFFMHDQASFWMLLYILCLPFRFLQFRGSVNQLFMRCRCAALPFDICLLYSSSYKCQINRPLKFRKLLDYHSQYSLRQHRIIVHVAVLLEQLHAFFC